MSKRLRLTDDNPQKDVLDYTSDLPPVLVSNILSRLPTKEAVRTSVLSSNWKWKWMSIYDVDMDDRSNYFSGENAGASFASVVTGLLLRLQPLRLRSFRLELCREPCDSSLVGIWISNVLRRNVRSMTIKSLQNQSLDSLWCFSGWTSLRSLVLEMRCTLKVPADNCFLNLIYLVLNGASHGGIKVITTKGPGTSHIVLIFRVLRFLILAHCEFLDVNYVEIQAPKLTNFKFCCQSKNYEIKICAPKLVILELAENGPLNTCVLSTSRAVTYLSFYNKLGDETSALRAHKMLTKFSNLKCLRIHGKALQALLRLKPGHVFPTFNLLKELEINFYCAIEDVLELLQMLPSLESLIISVKTLVEYEFGGALTSKYMSQLQEVELLNFYASKGQYNLAKHLLNNAMCLQKMTVTIPKVAGNVLQMTKLVEVVSHALPKLKPRGSSCDIVVVERTDRAWCGIIPREVAQAAYLS